jgi:hypothetical protein
MTGDFPAVEAAFGAVLELEADVARIRPLLVEVERLSAELHQAGDDDPRHGAVLAKLNHLRAQSDAWRANLAAKADAVASAFRAGGEERLADEMANTVALLRGQEPAEN